MDAILAYHYVPISPAKEFFRIEPKNRERTLKSPGTLCFRGETDYDQDAIVQT